MDFGEDSFLGFVYELDYIFDQNWSGIYWMWKKKKKTKIVPSYIEISLFI